MLISARRAFALGAGLTEADIANNTLSTLSGSGQTAPTYWLDRTSGVSHLVNLQTPHGGGGMQLLGGLSDITQLGRALVVSHRDIIPVVDIYANNQGRDLGAVSKAVDQVLKRMERDIPKGATVQVHGQAVTMQDAYAQLLGGLVLAIVLVYLAIVVNFQSWLDPFIIITALPGALTGVVWALFLTDTTLSVPALTGAIMSVGTATANSILVVSFARDELAAHATPSTRPLPPGLNDCARC